MYAAHGVNLPFMPVWYEKVRGLSGEQIGVVFAVALSLRFITGPLITAWVEGLSDPRRGYAALSVGLALSVAGAALAPNLAWLIFAAFCVQNCISSLFPYAEASTIVATRTGPISYGFGRALGSASFIIATLIMGMLLGPYGPWAAWLWVIVFALIMAVSIFQMPPPQLHTGARLGFRNRLRGMVALLREPNFARIIFAAAFIQSGHAFLYSFGTLTWLKQGLSSGQVGLLWSVGVLSEITLLLTSARLLRGRNPEMMLMLGGIIGIVRWSVLAFPLPFPILVLVQVLHAGSFALSHIAAMQLLDRMAGDRLPVAQTLYFSLGTGAFTGAGTLGAGWLYEHYQAGGYGAMTISCAIGVILLALRPKKPAIA
jgi:MFS transporter, PPP family, 3-phenylpropionic acid transporter